MYAKHLSVYSTFRQTDNILYIYKAIFPYTGICLHKIEIQNLIGRKNRLDTYTKCSNLIQIKSMDISWTLASIAHRTFNMIRTFAKHLFNFHIPVITLPNCIPNYRFLKLEELAPLLAGISIMS